MGASGARLLVLGAGLFQIDVIRCAVALGIHVVSLDNVPGNPGHALSHERVDCSTVDVEGVIAAARRLHVDGIVTAASDAALPALAAARSALGLPGAIPAELAHAMSNKASFRALQRDAHLETPSAVAGTDPDEVAQRAARLRGPLLVKPADSSGSRGVTRIDTLEALPEAARHAAAISRDGAVVVEEWVAGVEHGGDAFLRGGEIVDIVVTHKYLEGFAVAGHYVPAEAEPELTESVRNELERTCAALGYGDGPLNFDVMVSDPVSVEPHSHRSAVLEVGARTGGNGIPCLALRARGVDFHGHAVRQALGLPFDGALAGPLHSAGSVVLAASRPGVVRRLPDVEAARSRFDTLSDLRWSVAVGDPVDCRNDADSMLGLALFDCADEPDYAARRQALQAWVDSEISEATG